MDLSIIIVNWNSVALLRKCLNRLYAGTRGVNFEIIVVDNASFDGCERMLSMEFPEVIFIQSDVNNGFSAANNLGFAQSSGDALLFLNPDTEVVGNAVSALYFVLTSIPQAGVVGAKLLNSDLSTQTSCIQRFPSIINQLVDADVLRHAFPKSRLWGTWPLSAKQQRPVAVDAVSGACMMVSRETFERVGLFNPEYFMYSEDVDLCFKVHLAGRQNYYTDAAIVVHHGGASTKVRKQSYFSDVLMRRSKLLFFTLHKGVLYGNIYRTTTALAAVVRCLMLAAAVPYRSSCRHALSKWAAVLRWALWMSPE